MFHDELSIILSLVPSRAEKINQSIASKARKNKININIKLIMRNLNALIKILTSKILLSL